MSRLNMQCEFFQDVTHTHTHTHIVFRVFLFFLIRPSLDSRGDFINSAENTYS